VQTAYRAEFDEWEEFLTQKKWVPEFLSGLSFSWSAAEGLSLRYPGVSIEAGRDVFDWTEKSALFLAPGYYLQDGKLSFGIRKTVIQRDIRGRDFAILYKNVKPDPGLGVKAEETWSDLVGAKYPFDEVPRLSSKDNTGFAGTILPQARPSADVRYSVYLAMENPGSEDSVKNRLDALKGGIYVEQ
jgi:hypothetical protein